MINAESKFEAAGVCDVNNDGKLDIFSGGFWYEGPNWKKHFVRDVKYESWLNLLQKTSCVTLPATYIHLIECLEAILITEGEIWLVEIGIVDLG